MWGFFILIDTSGVNISTQQEKCMHVQHRLTPCQPGYSTKKKPWAIFISFYK